MNETFGEWVTAKTTYTAAMESHEAAVTARIKCGNCDEGFAAEHAAYERALTAWNKFHDMCEEPGPRRPNDGRGWGQYAFSRNPVPCK